MQFSALAQNSTQSEKHQAEISNNRSANPNGDKCTNANDITANYQQPTKKSALAFEPNFLMKYWSTLIYNIESHTCVY